MMTATRKREGGGVEPNLGKKRAEPNPRKNKALHRLGFRMVEGFIPVLLGRRGWDLRFYPRILYMEYGDK